MTTRLNPYLTFSGDARQAMDFYRAVFGGELQLITYSDIGSAENESEKDLVAHAMLTGDLGLTLMASDSRPEPSLGRGNGFSVSLSGDDEEVLTEYWNDLSAEGVVGTPFVKSSWGALYGTCTDKFGISWIVNVMSGQTS